MTTNLKEVVRRAIQIMKVSPAMPSYGHGIQERSPENELGDDGEFSSGSVTATSPNIGEFTINRNAIKFIDS